MDSTPAGIESEMLDLSTVDVSTLGMVDDVAMAAAMARVRNRLADLEGSISDYSGSVSSEVPAADRQTKDPIG